MPKLYYTPTSCGAANFIAAYTAGVRLTTEEVNLATHKTASGVDFYTINPKGNVPAIVLDDGTLLNENQATLQWIADQNPGSVGGPAGSVARFQLLDALSYISSEYHATIVGLFNPYSEQVDAYLREKLAKKLAYIESTLVGTKSFLVGNAFTIADAYLYIALTWTAYVKVDLAPYPNTKGYLERIGSLDNVKAAHARMAEKPTSTL